MAERKAHAPAAVDSDSTTDASSGLHDVPCSLLDFDRNGGIEKLASIENLQSWIVKVASHVAGSDVLPGTDLVILLESPDGVVNRLRIILATPWKPDAPSVIECRLSVLWNEVEVVNCILLPFDSIPRLSSFLGKLIGSLSHFVDDTMKINSERQAHAPLEASGEGCRGVKVQVGIKCRKHSRFQWLHDAICSAQRLTPE